MSAHNICFHGEQNFIKSYDGISHVLSVCTIMSCFFSLLEVVPVIPSG